MSLGIFDEEFVRGNVPMTKREVRILTVNEAKINENSIVYDIGAGTGSLSIEAALIAKNGKIYSIEKNTETIDLIKKNCLKFNINNIEIINNIAPNGMNALPPANSIFIGGSGGNLVNILNESCEKIKQNGIIVINAITVETLNTALNFISAKKNFTYYSYEVQISRYDSVGNYHLKKSENPISIIVCKKNLR